MISHRALWGIAALQPAGGAYGEMGHVWTAPCGQALLACDDCGRVQSCVWPVAAAILHDCWP
jgi:hypothetical protein